ncbi:MAG: general secretion pathway protein GspK, partial [Pirellulales bacterium]|nr:general secretion pathway protein GspK [Pirellulales bacterium]
ATGWHWRLASAGGGTLARRQCHPRYSAAKSRRGAVLVLVLVVTALLSLAALTFSQLMLVEHEASKLAAERVQSHALAASGVEAARWFLSQDAQVQKDAGSWYNNEEKFRGVLVTPDDDPYSRGRFALVAPAMEDGRRGGVRFGLEDESTRLNLNTLITADQQQPGSGRKILMGLPGMTEQIADAILDWIDADDEPREFGAEVEYYSGLDPPYAPKNGPVATVEELLLVRDVTPQLLFGVDLNRNGFRDPGEPDPMSIENVDNADGAMDGGWSAYLTLHSLELNLDPDGKARIDLNQDDMEKLHKQLSEVFDVSWANYIVAYRQNGPYESTSGTSTTLWSPDVGELDLTRKGQFPLSTVLDLIGKPVQVQFKEEDKKRVIGSPFLNVPGVMSVYLPKLMDHVTVNKSPMIPGRININQASRTVLMGIPGMTQDIVDQIVSVRRVDPAEAEDQRRHETWILAEGIVDLDQMKALMPFVCGGGCVFRTQAVGYFDAGGPATRLEVILDTTKRPARVLFWRELSHLGRGYARETLGIEAP